MKPRLLATARLSFPLASAIAMLLTAQSASAQAAYYWDIDAATAGAGGTTPSGTWSTGGTTWSTNSSGTVATPGVTTSLLDDLFFSAGVNATGAYAITLNDAQAAKSLTFQDGTATISGAGGVINLGGTGIIRVNNSLTGTALTANIGNTTTTLIGGTAGLTKTGVGTLTLDGSAVHTFTGGLNVNGGILNLNFANLATPTNLIDSSNALAIGGSGRLLITGKNSGTTDQTFGNVTVGSGGGQLLGNVNGGTALNITLGSLTTTANGGSLLVGTTVGGTAPTITTATDKDATGIYGGRVVFFNGTANTGYDWATSSGSGPYTLGAYAGYAAMATSGTDTANSRITASHTLTGNLTTNSLKFQAPATAQILDLGGNTLTVSSGGILFTGAGVTQGPRITNGVLTAGADSNYDLVVHQYQANNNSGGTTGNNTSIAANISNNGANAVTLVKAGTGSLLLSRANSFTGGIVINDGGTFGWGGGGAVNYLNNNSLTFNANTIVLANETTSTNGGITLNNGSQVEFRNNTKTFTVNGAVTGTGGGITLGQNGGGATVLNFNSTGNTFTGPIRYAVTAQNGTLTVNSLADSSAVGEGNITFGVSGSVPHNFNYGTGAVAALTLNNRRFELTGTGNNQTASINNNSSQALTINTDLLTSVTGTTTKNFTLGGTGLGLSTFAGAIPLPGGTATINLVKNGSGMWVLSGTNSYNGTTTVSAGKLLINGNSSTVTGNVNVAGTGTTLGGTGAIGGSITVAANAILAPGAGIESLATGSLTLQANSTFAYEIDNDASASTTGDLAAVTGNLTIDVGNLAKLTLAELGSGTWTIGEKLTLISYSGTWNGGLFNYASSTIADDSAFTFSGVDWFFDYNDTNPGTNFTGDLAGSSFVTMTVIPEPGAAFLGGLGLLALLRRRR